MATTGAFAHLRTDESRLMQRIFALAEIAPIEGGGNCRLALTDEDRDGRNLVLSWMKDLDLEIGIDSIGNVVGTWNVGTGLPVLTGSHIDTVRTGGKYDGNYGVLAGLQVIETCQRDGYRPSRPLAVGFFTDEEGARFAPDMLGSLVYAGGLPLEVALDTTSIDGARLGDELARIGYAGPLPCPGPAPHAFVEVHIEQGPVLEANQVLIGAVTGVQGISWQELTITGQSNHAGTTPMSMRHDPAYVAAEIAVFARKLANRVGGHQVCTAAKIDIHPNLVNVVPARATITLDIRNTDEDQLQHAEAEMAMFVNEIALNEGVTTAKRVLARFEPVEFDRRVVDCVEETARSFGLSVQRMPSGAGHDAQMIARICPSGMIFVPSVNGISHNPAEHTGESDLHAGSNVLLHVMLKLAEMELKA
ncbi:MAG: M20 family metallo-hydrolase [Ilumatobacteraceae bacterium]